MPVNQNFSKLPKNYFFSAIGRRASEFEKEHPEKRLIRLSIRDRKIARQQEVPLPGDFQRLKRIWRKTWRICLTQQEESN